LHISTDRIEKNILLRAPRNRVWRALADSAEFGTWFGVKFDAPFTPGTLVQGVLVPSKVDPESKYAGLRFDITIEQMEPERIFSFRWHPHAIDPNFDYSLEPTTLVVFTLEDAAEGILLTVTESGFDQIPLARRITAFTSNDGGWAEMVKVFAEYIGNGQ